MAKNKEAKFVAKVHKHIPEYVYYQSLYTPYSGGTPDYFYSGVEDCLFVEYKYQDKLPKVLSLCNKEIKYPLLTAKQQSWLNGRYCEGRNVAVVYGCLEGAVIFEHMAWENPMSQEVFRAKRLDAESIAHWIIEKVSIKKHVKNREILPL